MREILLRTEGDVMYEHVLREVRELFGCRFGFFGYIRETDGALVCPSLTHDIWEQCSVADKSVVFPREGWSGLWGRVLIERGALFKNEIHKTPPGHVLLQRSLGAAIVLNDELIGSIHIANREEDFTDADAQLLAGICRVIAPVLQVRSRMGGPAV